MQSNKLLKLAHEIAVRDKIVFDTLMEFERDKRIRTKKRLNFTIDKNVANKFRKYCREHGYNMSSKIEKAMKEIVS